jgi:hypothetical protein
MANALAPSSSHHKPLISWCRPGVVCLTVSFLDVSSHIVFMDIIVDFAALLFAM